MTNWPMYHKFCIFIFIFISLLYSGYRKVWHILKNKGLPVKRNTVMNILKELDPEAVTGRRKHKLKRRVYSVPGPDFLWHIDGYDKLKPFGFSVHGCIDGYSRRLIWLEVSSTNKKPEVIAKFYMDAVKQVGGVPSRIRADDGSEMSTIEPIQIALRLAHDDEFSGEASFLIGTSPANQKIECYWSQLTKEKPLWWRIFFKELSSYGFIDSSNILVIEALRYCFMDLIRKDIEDVAVRWNQHLIAPSKNSILPRGKPDCLYFLPEKNNTFSYKKTVSEEDIAYFDDPRFAETTRDNDPDFVEFAQIALEIDGSPEKPDCPSSGLRMYFYLLEIIEECL